MGCVTSTAAKEPPPVKMPIRSSPRTSAGADATGLAVTETLPPSHTADDATVGSPERSPSAAGAAAATNDELSTRVTDGGPGGDSGTLPHSSTPPFQVESPRPPPPPPPPPVVADSVAAYEAADAAALAAPTLRNVTAADADRVGGPAAVHTAAFEAAEVAARTPPPLRTIASAEMGGEIAARVRRFSATA